MGPPVLFVILLVLMLAAVFYLLAPRHWPATQSRSSTWRNHGAGQSGPKQQYSAVTIEGDCSFAKALAGRRFLSSEAPNLPLRGCQSTDCRCRYVHYQDRRSLHGDRRAVASSAGSTQYLSEGRPERRIRRDRRVRALGGGIYSPG